MSKAKTQAKRRGRPVTIAASSVISLKMPPSLVTAISQWASVAGVTRSEAARRLIELGLTVKLKAKPR